MSKEDDKNSWSLKQSTPSSIRIPKDKVEAFEQGAMNVQKKHLSKKEQEELRKKQEEEAAAEVLRDYLVSFEDAGKSVKTFIKGSTINPATKEEKLIDKGALYKPALKLQEKLSTPPVSRTLLSQQHHLLSKSEKKETESEKNKRLQQEKKKSNLETFKEELKRLQEEREARHKQRHQQKATSESKDDKVKSSDKKVDLDSETPIKTQLTDEDITTNIFLSNLNPNTNERDVMEKFGHYGPLGSVKIMWPRTEEDRQRGANCGFVAFMARKDAEAALRNLDGTSIDGISLRLSWSKSVALPAQPIYIPPHLIEVTVPPPPSGLPFNAQPKNEINDFDLYKILESSIVKVTIPTDRQLLCLIHRMIEYVVREGPAFEAIIMTKETNNPQFRFLFDNQSPAHVYYRWKLFSVLQGDSVSNWNTESFQMFKNGSYWIPPVCNSYTKGEKDESFEKARQELEMKRGQLSDENRDKLEDILRNLTTMRSIIGEAMVFCIDNADCWEEIVDCIVESLTIAHTPIHKKISRLFLVSDLLHNCGVKRAHASFYRKGFEKCLPDIFKHLNDVLNGVEGKLRIEALKKKVLNCIRAWVDLAIYPTDYLLGLQNSFLGLNNKILQQYDNSNSRDGAMQQQQQYQDDIDGKPLETSANDQSNDTANEDIDGKPFNEYDDSLDGKPLSDDENHNGKKEATTKFIKSKWEEVDPEQLEKQAITTSKWDFFDEYQSDDDSQDFTQALQRKDNGSKLSDNASSNENASNQQYSESATLYQQYNQQKEHLNEEKRQMLRDIEVKAVKYMDDLEAGRIERNKNLSIQEQLEQFRHELFRSKFDKMQDRNSTDKNRLSSPYSKNSSKYGSERGSNTSQRSNRHRSRSRSHSRSRSRSRSRSPSHRQRYSSTSSSTRNKLRSRSNSPSKRYKKFKH